MTNNKQQAKKVISTRLEPLMIAKARDGLKLKGYGAEQLSNASNIVRLTFLHGLAELQPEPNSEASPESLLWVQQRIKQNKRKTNLSLGDLIK